MDLLGFRACIKVWTRIIFFFSSWNFQIDGAQVLLTYPNAAVQAQFESNNFSLNIPDRTLAIFPSYAEEVTGAPFYFQNSPRALLNVSVLKIEPPSLATMNEILLRAHFLPPIYFGGFLLKELDLNKKKLSLSIFSNTSFTYQVDVPGKFFFFFNNFLF
jgi:hypothetical protein